jgi:hypothetical protein
LQDKATIFIAALAKMGVVAYPVLLNSRGGVRRELPTIEQLDHVIAAIKKGSGYQFVDLTAGLTPFGQLPYGEQGEFGLVVHPDRTSEEVTLPEDPESGNATTMRIVGTLSENGIFDGAYQEEDSGVGQYFLREALENPLDSAARANIPRSIAGRFFRGADADSLQSFNGKDLSRFTTPKRPRSSEAPRYSRFRSAEWENSPRWPPSWKRSPSVGSQLMHAG